jgi:excisionase family DNA binding protein
MSANRDESFLTVAEVADWLKVNQQTVRNWIDQGRLPAVRVGRRVRIKRSDFDRIMGGGAGGEKPSAGIGPPGRPGGPSAEDFWSGEQVGMAEPDPSARPERTPASEANRQRGRRSDEDLQEPRTLASP